MSQSILKSSIKESIITGTTNGDGNLFIGLSNNSILSIINNDASKKGFYAVPFRSFQNHYAKILDWDAESYTVCSNEEVTVKVTYV